MMRVIWLQRSPSRSSLVRPLTLRICWRQVRGQDEKPKIQQAFSASTRLKDLIECETVRRFTCAGRSHEKLGGGELDVAQKAGEARLQLA
jgi:hypothetical protein